MNPHDPPTGRALTRAETVSLSMLGRSKLTPGQREAYAIHGSYTPGQMEAYKSGVEDGKWLAKSSKERLQKARIPPLKPHRIPQYIAAIARAVASGGLTAAQGNGLLYAAQVTISLMRAQQPPSPPPAALGFKAPKKSAEKIGRKKESQK